MSMEQQIGEKFDYNGITLEVVEAYDKYSYCAGCYFEDVDCRALKGDVLGFCAGFNRKDLTNIIYKRVE